MVDVVELHALGDLVELHEVADRLDDVLVGEDALVGGTALALLLLEEIGRDAEPRLLPRLPVGVVAGGECLATGAQLRGDRALDLPELLVDLVATDAGEVVALRVEVEVLEERARRVGRGRLARTELAVDVLEGLVLGLDVVLLEGRLDRGRVVEGLEDLLGGPAEGLEEDGDGLPALAVDADADGVLLVDVELEPGAAARDHLRDVEITVGGLVRFAAEVDARRAHELRDDDALGAVDDEGPVLGHHGELPHEDLLLLDLARLPRDEHRLDEETPRVRDVLVPALLDRVGRFLEAMLAEVELELLGVILDRRDLVEDLAQSRFDEPVEGRPLDGHEVRERERLPQLREGDAVADRDERVGQGRSPLGWSGVRGRSETSGGRVAAKGDSTRVDGGSSNRGRSPDPNLPRLPLPAPGVKPGSGRRQRSAREGSTSVTPSSVMPPSAWNRSAIALAIATA